MGFLPKWPLREGLYNKNDMEDRRYAKMNEKIGYWAFIIGVMLAIIAGLFSNFFKIIGIQDLEMLLPPVLVALGLIVGFLNIGDRDIRDFLLAVIAIAVVASANIGALPIFGLYLQPVVAYLAIFIMPAALVVALKVVYALGSSSKA